MKQEGRRRIFRAVVAAAALVAAGVPVPAVAQGATATGIKLAVIDVRRLVTDSVAGKDALAKLRKLQEGKVAESKAKQEEIDQLRKRLTEGRLSLADDKLAELEKQLEEMVTGYRRFQEDAERELNKSQEQAFADIERRVGPVIDQFGREGGYTLIFNKFQSGLVFADTTADVTDQIIQRFDAAQTAPKTP